MYSNTQVGYHSSSVSLHRNIKMHLPVPLASFSLDLTPSLVTPPLKASLGPSSRSPTPYCGSLRCLHIHVIVYAIVHVFVYLLQFTFASNAATVVGGVLVTNKYKLRLPAAFLSAFFISVGNPPSPLPSPYPPLSYIVQGIVHPVIARLIWSDSCHSLSPYRFCTYNDTTTTTACNYGCTANLTLTDRLYVLDFAGGGAVHLLGTVKYL